MNNINVLILDDKKADSDELVKVLTANNYTIAGVARSGAEALAILYKTRVDVIIIDIFLGGSPEGMHFAETINIIPNASKPFVFLTGSNDRQVFERARLTQPSGFLLKPFNVLEVLYAIEMAVERSYVQPDVFHTENQDTIIGDEYLFIKKKDSLKKVMIADIVYIEVEERYCNMITENEKFLVMISLTKIMEVLDTKKFVRTHRNYIVNTEKITEIFLSDNLVMLKGNHNVIISDKYKEMINRFRILK